MSKEAEKLASLLERPGYGWSTTPEQCAALLRRQAEQIRELRTALSDCLDDSQAAVDQYVLDYGEGWRPGRLAAMRAIVARARIAIINTTEKHDTRTRKRGV